jgi:DNA-binding helix-hairpin-helix protein with protein kinase domain
MNATLFTSDGKPTQLGMKIGKGGEGEVFAVHGASDIAVKIYTVTDPRSREAKISAMVSAGLVRTSSLIAFPLSVVRDRKGSFVGFTMPLVTKHQALHELYSPGARKTAFPKADYRFLVRTAANTARAIAAAHVANCVVGDINHSGILVSEQATVALIDADSFQVSEGVTQHLCLVGVPEYTPPELQGKSLPMPRTPNHDAFGLAVVCFQLLFMGRHPFAGGFARGEMPIERAISEFRFAYSRLRNVGMEPPPATPSLEDFPTQIANAFEDAFGPSGINKRPTAAQWVKLLEALEHELRVCGVKPLHHYPSTAKECPWCRMEQIQGIQLFIPPAAISSPQINFNIADWQAIWTAIEAIKTPDSPPSAPNFVPLNLAPSQDAIEAKSRKTPDKIFGVLVIVVCLSLFAALPAAGLLWLIGIAGGAYYLSSRDGYEKDFIRQGQQLEESWSKSLTEWRAQADSTAFALAKATLADVKGQIEGLTKEEIHRTQQFELQRRDTQLNLFLNLYRIRNVRISGIGPSRLALLTSHGIETAADVTQSALLRVPGFGPVTSLPLLEWRRSVEAKFRFSVPHTAADVTALANIKGGIANKARILTARLANGHAELSRIISNIERLQQVGTPELQRLHKERSQIAADLNFLGLPMPQPVSPPTKFGPAVGGHSFISAGQSANPYPTSSPRPQPVPSSIAVGGLRCPRCGGPMITRKAKRGRRSGSLFYGCSRYPSCQGTRAYP